MWLEGEAEATIRAEDPSQPLLITHVHDQLHLHVSNLHLVGHLVVRRAKLSISNCIIQGAHKAEKRAVSIAGGDVSLTNTILFNHSAGALTVSAATLTVAGCIIRDCRAATGGAMLILGGSNVTIENSTLIRNRANTSGGALQVPLERAE